MDSSAVAVPSRRRFVSPWGLLEAIGVVAAGATLTGFLARIAWWLELTCHFRLQLAVVLGALAVAGLLGRRHRLTLGAGAFASINAALVLLAARPVTTADIPSAAPRLRVLSLNVHTANTRSDLVLATVRQAEPDLVVLLEVNHSWMTELAPLRAHYPFTLAEPREDNFGIALFSRVPLQRLEAVELGQAQVPSLLAEVSLGGRPLRVLGTHPLPPGSPGYAWARNDQLRAIAAWCRQQPTPVAVCGDLNVTPWSPHFADLLRAGDLCNGRPNWGLGISWPAQQPWLGIALDHCLTSPAVVVMRREVLGSVHSDHWPLLVELALR